MQALVIEEFGGALQLKEVATPQVGPNDVLIQVNACGVGLTVVNLLATPGRVKTYPRIPGHEIAGKVLQVGSQVSTVRVGDRVTNHFYLTCGQCIQCRSGRETLCTACIGNVGQAIDGGYAEMIVLPERNVVLIPEGVSDIEAAVGSDAIATPYHACVKEAKLKPSDTVLVIGAAGGVGIHMIQMARLCGATVFAADRGSSKMDFIQSIGADYVIDAAQGSIVDQVMAATNNQGVDAVIDIVGSKYSLEQGMACLAIAGRLVIVGSSPPGVYKEDPSFLVDPQRFLHRGLEIHAARYVTLAEISRTLELIRDKKIKPIITQTVSLSQIPDLHQAIREGKTLGRVGMVRN